MPVIDHTVITDEASIVDKWKPRVLYNNLFRSGTVTVSSALADFPKELAYNGLTYDAWKTNAVAPHWIRVQSVPAAAVDSMAIGSHTLMGCTLTPQHSADGAAWTNLVAPYVATSNRPLSWEFAQITPNYIRLLIENAGNQVSIGVIGAGLKLMMTNGLPIGFKPPSLNEMVEHTNTISQGGQTLGRNVIRRGVEAVIDTQLATYLWARDSWATFIKAAEEYGFFMWWLTQGRAEIVYGGLESHTSQFSDPLHVNAQFRMAGLNR